MLLLRAPRISRVHPILKQISSLERLYSMAPVPSSTLPLIISGPSGVGKGTLYKLLLQRHPNVFTTSISHTTRDPRPGETRDVDYYYVKREEFENLIGEDGFVEHATFGGNRYGTSRGMLQRLSGEGKVVVLDIEMEGVKQIKASRLPARYVFIAPPSMEILESRLRGRGTEKEDSIQKRLAQAKLEMEYAKGPNVHDLVIVNDDLETAYREMEGFVFGKAGKGEKTQEQDAKEGERAGVSVLD